MRSSVWRWFGIFHRVSELFGSGYSAIVARWTNRSKRLSPGAARLQQVKLDMDRAVYGLGTAKAALLDHLAVATLHGSFRPPVPCLVGPAAVGKRALVQAFSASLDRSLRSLDLTKLKWSVTEAVSVDSSPGLGRLVEKMQVVASEGAAVLFENLDALRNTGDPGWFADALRPSDQQRSPRWERWGLSVPRLGQTLVIATARDFSAIPDEIRGYFIEVRVPGYTPEEKVEILKEFMLAELISETGLKRRDVRISTEALVFLARGYARDAGMEEIRHLLLQLLRRCAFEKLANPKGVQRLTKGIIEDVLGPPREVFNAMQQEPEVGVVRQLAATASGGEVVAIEALTIPGSGRLVLTGNMPEATRDSVNTAFSYVRSQAMTLGIPDTAFSEFDTHVHFPFGVELLRDSPGGIAVCLVLASVLSNRTVRPNLVVAGETTLRGRLLEPKHLYEQVLAAYRAEVTDVLLPAASERALSGLPEVIRNRINVHFARDVTEVFALALLPR